MDTRFKDVGLFGLLVSFIVGVEVFGYLLSSIGFEDMVVVFWSGLVRFYFVLILFFVLLLVYVVFKIDKADYERSVSENMGVNYDEGRSLLGAFFSYLRHPRYDVGFLDKSVFSKLCDVGRFVGIAVFLCFVIIFVTSFVTDYFGYNFGDNSNDVMLRENFLLVVLSAVVLAPLIEEVVFRSFLRYRPFRLSLFIGFVYITFLFQFVDVGSDWKVWGFYGVVLLVFFGLGFVFRFLLPSGFMKGLYRRYFFVLFYSVVLLFGFAHVFNYSNWMSMWVLAPLLVLPQLVGGVMLGYVRMLYGLKWSVFFHLFFNGFLVLAGVLSYYYLFLFGDLSAFSMGEVLLVVVGMVLFGLLCVLLFIGGVYSLVEFLVKRFKDQHSGDGVAFFLYHH